MKSLKESFIKAKDLDNIKNSSSDSFLYCICNYDDSLDLPKKEVNYVRSKDWVDIYILNKDEVKKYSKDLSEMLCDIWKVKDTTYTIDSLYKLIRSNIWRNNIDRKICEKVEINNITESFIKAKDLDKINNHREYYLVNPYNEYYDLIDKKYWQNRFETECIGIIFILSYGELIDIIKNDNHSKEYFIENCFIYKFPIEFNDDIKYIDKEEIEEFVNLNFDNFMKYSEIKKVFKL